MSSRTLVSYIHPSLFYPFRSYPLRLSPFLPFLPLVWRPIIFGAFLVLLLTVFVNINLFLVAAAACWRLSFARVFLSFARVFFCLSLGCFSVFRGFLSFAVSFLGWYVYRISQNISSPLFFCLYYSLSTDEPVLPAAYLLYSTADVTFYQTAVFLLRLPSLHCFLF